MIIREIIIDTDKNYKFSSGRPYSIIIYEYFGDGKAEKLHEGYIDTCVDYLCETENIGIVWTDYNEFLVNQLSEYLYEKGMGTSRNLTAYNYIKESKFTKRFISYWIETRPEKYVRW